MNKSFNIAKKFLEKKVEVLIDRPVGLIHPKHEDIVYELNYGYIAGVKAPDGEDLDAYCIGEDKPVKEFVGKCVAIVHREDDDDDKLVVVTKEFEDICDKEIMKKVKFQEKFFKSRVMR